MLGVMPSKLVKGCNSLQGTENLIHFQNNCQEVMLLKDMLSRQFRTDAHFTSYNLTGMPQWPRLNISILPEIREEGEDIVLAFLTFDWDNADHSGWTDELLNEFTDLLVNCTDPVISAWSAVYTTKHGVRIIYTMSQKVPVDEAQLHLAWMFNHFKENGFNNIDESCRDWTRCMRCPQVIRDGVPTWEQTYYSCTTQDVLLNMDLVGKRSVVTVPRKTYFNKEKQEIPAYDQLEKLIVVKDVITGRNKQTEFSKKAKKALKDSGYLDILFNNAAPDWAKGSRNDEIVKMIGSVTPVLLSHTRASVQHIFALVIEPLLTLESDQDWLAHGWNALLDIYEREVNKINLDREEKAQEVSDGISLLDTMREGMKEWCSHPDLINDEHKGREFILANCIASAQGYLYLMEADGRYLDFAINKDQVISRIRRTSLDKIISTTKINYTGEENDVPISLVLNDFCTPVAEVHMKPVGGAGGYIDDINGEKPTLVLSTFCRNDTLIPKFDPFVDEWLKHLFGEHYDIGCSWIGNALAFEEGLICALSIEGASSAGKKLLTEGLSECLKRPYVAGPEAMYHQSSAFLKTPFLVVNEAWPRISGATSPADKFKSLTGGDGIIVNEKFKPSVRVLCPVRLIMTANDDGIIKELISGKDMGLDNRIAIGERLYHIKATSKAMIYLQSIGGRSFTARKGQRWIRPDSGSDGSNYVVARHFLWLYKNRDVVDATQRFLVMGNCAPGTGTGQLNVLEKLLADNNFTPTVALAIIEMVDSKQGQWSQYVKTNQEFTKIWVTRYGVHKYVKEVLEERVTEKDIYSGMLNLMERVEPDKYNEVHWYEISVEILSMIATERGIAQTHVRNIQINRIEKGLVSA